MAGKIGRSGRRSLTDEAERARIRQLAWQRTGEMLTDDAILKHGLPKVCGIVATPIVKADMAKPIVVNANIENHTHHTKIDLSGKSVEELIYIATGRVSGHTAKPQ